MLTWHETTSSGKRFQEHFNLILAFTLPMAKTMSTSEWQQILQGEQADYIRPPSHDGRRDLAKRDGRCRCGPILRTD